MMERDSSERNIRFAVCGETIEPGGPPGTIFFVGEGDAVCRQCMLKLDPASVRHADAVDRLLGTDPERN